jgi:N-methylhydantoinase A
MTTSRPWRVGIDVGGTFTDGLLWNADSGATYASKVLSTPDDPGRAILTTFERLLQAAGAAGTAVSYLVHGTTVATNAVLQRRLARTAFVTTKGFGDLLEIARQVRSDPYDVFACKPEPLVERDMCFEVEERLDADGEVVVPLAEASLAALPARLKQVGIEAVAVCLLHGYRNPMHERRVAELLRRELPGVAVSVSSDLASEFREYPRACTTIVNVGLMPEVSGYLERFDAELGRRGVAGDRLIMQSNGGVANVPHSAGRPVFLLESGPAAGVVGAAHLAGVLGERNIISFDMGGTTAKLGLVQGGRPHRVHEFEVGTDANRSRTWFAGAAGYPILTPAVDLVDIGTGGGSIAWIDDGGQLRVGPQSAGAAPGPACYGLGGAAATITDADLVLGRLDPGYFLGGEMHLDRAAAEQAVRQLADQLGLDVEACAEGIVRIADSAMSQALRLVSVQRGYDPAGFKLVAFGGAGPLHAIAVAAETGIATVLVPPRPGLASAFGLLAADLKHDFAATRVERVDGADPAALAAVFSALADEGRTALAREGVPPAQMDFDRALDLRYVGQSYQLTVALDPGPFAAAALLTAASRFNEMHLATYGYADPREPCEIVTLRVTAVGRIPKPALNGSSAQACTPEAALKGRRPVRFATGGTVECPVYARKRLVQGARLAGPAVLEAADSTILVHPGWDAVVAPHGILALNRQDGGTS